MTRFDFLSDAMISVIASKATVQTISAATMTAVLAGQMPANIWLIGICGACGGLARWVALRQRAWPDGIGSLLLGMLAGVFLWPMGQPISASVSGRLEMDPVTAVMFGAFVTGLCGVGLIGLILDVTNAQKKRQEEQDADRS